MRYQSETVNCRLLKGAVDEKTVVICKPLCQQLDTTESR
jgi:hypothetical protein